MRFGSDADLADVDAWALLRVEQQKVSHLLDILPIPLACRRYFVTVSSMGFVVGRIGCGVIDTPVERGLKLTPQN